MDRRLLSSPERSGPAGTPYSMLYRVLKGPALPDAKARGKDLQRIMGSDENYKMIKQLLTGIERHDRPLGKRRDGASYTVTTTSSTRHQRSTDVPKNFSPPFPSSGSNSNIQSVFNGRRSSFGKKK